MGAEEQVRPATFEYRGVRLPYLNHPYNKASLNERSVEVPIAARYVYSARLSDANASILEVGNVLGHYLTGPRWAVLDAREKGKHIINADIMTWQTEERYDLITSVSTLEHVGFGKYASYAETVTPGQIVERLIDLLVDGGSLLATVPIGFNPRWDRALKERWLGLDCVGYSCRVNEANEWCECDAATAHGREYDTPYRWANAVAIIEYGPLKELLWQN